MPWGLEGVELGEEVLEIGPGFGATTRLLAPMVRSLSVVELEDRYCEQLRSELGERVSVRQGDATQLPCPDERFSAVLCFTMLHHIPARQLQDRAFAEVARVLRPGGVFAGTDSIGTGLLFKAIHAGDTLLSVDPAQLPARLQNVGLTDPRVHRSNGSFRFRAYKGHRPG